MLGDYGWSGKFSLSPGLTCLQIILFAPPAAKPCGLHNSEENDIERFYAGIQEEINHTPKAKRAYNHK